MRRSLRFFLALPVDASVLTTSWMLAAVALVIPVASLADPINVVSPASLTVPFEVTFLGIPEGNFDTILVSDGVAFAERFDGQSLTFNGDFDVLSGTPNEPLTLQAGTANQNLYVTTAELNPPGNAGWLYGVGPLGSLSPAGLAEGAVAALFPVDQSQILIDLVGINDFPTAATATIAFFRRDGSLIQQIAVDLVSNIDYYGFARDGDVHDIAGFSVFNDDLGGIAFDNVFYNACSSPTACFVVAEPSSIVLMLTAGLVLAAARRWARRSLVRGGVY